MFTLNGVPTTLQKGDLIIFNNTRKLVEFRRPLYGQLYIQNSDKLSMAIEENAFVDVATLIAKLFNMSITKEKFNSEHITGFRFL